MSKTHFYSHRAWMRLCGLAVVCLVAGRAHGQYDPDWARHFRLGMLAGFNIKGDFKLGGSLAVSGNSRGVYDDGYVIPNSKNTVDDYTSNWGYQRASQFDGDHTLTMHRTDSFSPATAGSVEEDNDPAHIGLDLVYGGNLWYWKRLRVGWDFGFGFLPIQISDARSFQANLNRSVFTFDTGSLTFFPPPGYQGHANSDGANIHSTPNPQGADTNSTVDTVSGSRSLDVTLYAFRLGPSLFWDVNRYVGLSLGAGPALGLVSGNYRFKERIGDNTPNKGSFGTSDLLFGGYVEGTLTFHLVKNGDLYISGQYMPLGTASFEHAGRQAKLNMDGAVFVSAGINWPF